MKHAKCFAKNKSWDEKPYKEFDQSRKLTKATVVQTLTGDLEGELATEYVMAYASDSYVSYVGMGTVIGTLDGKAGSFVLQLTGLYDGNEATGTWFVVPGTGTGQLATLRGEGTFRSPHGTKMDISLDYQLEPASTAAG